jgi:muconolactone D-isomerase
VRDNAHLHDLLMGLPLYPFMDIAVTALSPLGHSRG